MLGLLAALAMATSGGVAPEDKTIHSCPNGWEVGSTDGNEWTCEGPDGVIWKSPDGVIWSSEDGVIWSYPDPYGTEGVIW